jgi:capsular polysaccharide export protein
MKPIVFFAASRDQRNYFTVLSQHLSFDSDVVWYKSLVRPCFLTQLPVSELWQQAKLLTKRKQNSRKGRHKPNFVWPIFTSLSFLQACWLYAVYIAWLNKLPTTTVGIWNGKKFRQAILVIALKATHKNSIFFETGPLPGVSAIDPLGVNFYSSIPNKVAFYLNRAHSGEFDTPRDVASQTTRPGNLPENYILVPFQVVEDSNIYLHSPWIHNMRQLFIVCQSLSAKLGDETTFVFKEHPACDETYDDLRALQTPQLQFVDDVSTPALVEHATAIMTVNSTVGIEGLMARKKVFVLGDALFGIEGISYPVRSEDVLLEYLFKLEALELDETAISSFIDYLKNDYSIPQNAMQNPGDIHWQATEQRIQLLLDGKIDEALKLNNRAH